MRARSRSVRRIRSAVTFGFLLIVAVASSPQIAGATRGAANLGAAGSVPAKSAAQSAAALTQDMVWRNIGPANTGGRVTDIEAVEGDFKRVLVGTATGGVWKSTNGGNSWEPIFDDYEVVSVGDLAIYQPNPDIIWVGTGEANNQNWTKKGRT